MEGIFIKTFSNYDFAFNFLNKGSMFFRSARQFAVMEDDVRQDMNEGKATYMINNKFIDVNGKPTIRIHHPNIETKKILEEELKGLTMYASNTFSGAVKDNKKIVFDKEISCLIYSLSYIDLSKDFSDLDIYKFGKHMIIINNIEIFMERIKSYFQNLKLDFFSGQVHYYSDQSYKLHTILRKNEIYKGEHEYRFIINNSVFKEKLYNIGCISDIANYLTSSQLKKFLLKYNNSN